MWTRRHFWKTVGAETENLGAYVELFSTEGGLRVDFIKTRGRFRKTAEAGGVDPVVVHVDDAWQKGTGPRW